MRNRNIPRFTVAVGQHPYGGFNARLIDRLGVFSLSRAYSVEDCEALKKWMNERHERGDFPVMVEANGK